MADDRLGQDLRKVEGPAAPRAEFVEALYQRLIDERATRPKRALRSSPVRRRRPGPLLLVAALLVIGALIGTVVVGGGVSRSVPTVRASPAPPSAANGLASARATIAPTRSPRPSVSVLPTPLPVAKGTSGLEILASGPLIYEDRQIGKTTRLRITGTDASSREFAPDVPGTQRAPAWAPDGKHVVFAAAPLDTPDAWRIWRTGPDGSKPTPISDACDLPDCLAESEPVYAPDGRHIAFVRTAPGVGGGPGSSVLAVRDLTSGTVTELASTTRAADRQLLHPTFSPDGSEIAFAIATRPDAVEVASAIWVVGSDDTRLRQITEDSLVAGDPAWSPDGTHILFGTYPIRVVWQENQRAPDISHLYTMAPDGSNVLRLPLPEQSGGASWISGGDAILFSGIVASGERSPGYTWLMTVDAAASEVRAITRDTTCCSWYAVQRPMP